MCLLTALAAVCSVLVSCSRPEEETIATTVDHSSPMAGEYVPAPVSDYSSPVAVADDEELLAQQAAAVASQPPQPASVPDDVEDIRTISHGNEIVLGEYVVEGKTTLFEFYSKFSPRCERVAPHLARLVEVRDDIKLVIVDIDRPEAGTIDRESPVSLQFRLRTDPQFMIYGEDGLVLLEGTAASQQVFEWLESLD